MPYQTYPPTTNQGYPSMPNQPYLLTANAAYPPNESPSNQPTENSLVANQASPQSASPTNQPMANSGNQPMASPAHPPMTNTPRPAMGKAVYPPMGIPSSQYGPEAKPDWKPLPELALYATRPALQDTMAQTSYAPLASTVHVSVIGPQFCVPNPLDLAIVRKVMVLTGGNFVVTDASDNIMLKIEVPSALHDRRVLVDAAGNPIKWSMHSRWQVFRGDSRDDADLLFSAITSSFIQLKTKLDVFLAENTAEELCDFKVEGSWLDRSCTIYAGNCSAIVAQHKASCLERTSSW
ncbi:hypothetical protein RJ639_006002 [Escallonia herrerae]|uniref:Uncharacterized protein n=1 Tax=Escallonia herrerae TaxID=1293975 RepID=A0AA88W1E2_9ASTE|nr:hypothetical protein RJ639_006002 [Escallonia herrerae]